MISSLTNNLSSPYIIFFIGLAVSLLQIIGSVGLGASLYHFIFKKNIFFEDKIHLYFGLGAAAQCLIISFLSIFGLLSKTVVIASYILVIFFGARWFRLNLNLFRFNFDKKITIDKALFLIALSIVFLYVAFYCFIPFYGADIGIYHLVAVRDLIWFEGYRYNPFFFGSGIPQGWQHYGVIAYFWGGEAAYLGLSFWCFIGILLIIKRVGDQFLANRQGLVNLVVLSTGILIVNFLQDSAPNNDIPATYIELIIIFYFLFNKEIKYSRVNIVTLGLLSGFLLSIKLTNIVGVLIIYSIYLFRCRQNFMRVLIPLALATALLGVLWPLMDLIDYGSPLPQALAAFKIHGHFLPQLVSANAIIENYHGGWYSENFSRLFSLRYLSVLISITFSIFMLPFVLKFDKAFRVFIFGAVSYGLVRVALFFLISPRLDVLFHDRYHLISYILLSMVGLLIIFCKFDFGEHSKKSYLLIGLGYLTLFFGILSSSILKFPNGDNNNRPSFVVIPSILESLTTRFNLLYRSNVIFRSDIVAYIQESTPADAIIGTLVMAPYAYNRKFSQLLPLSQSKIDLTLSPEDLLNEIRKNNISYLHLTNSPGLVPGVASAIAPWLSNLNQIPLEPGVQLIKKIDYGNGIQEALYKIN